MKKLLSIVLTLCMAVGVFAAFPIEVHAYSDFIELQATDADFIIEDGVLVKCLIKRGHIEIPHGVREIGADAFANEPVGSFSFGGDDSLTVYGNRGITSITLPDSVTKIRDSAFSNVRGVKNIYLPAGLLEIGTSAFSQCESLEEINIPSTVTTIGSGAFFYCLALESISIPSSVKELGDRAFNRCTSLREVTIAPGGITKIGESVFGGCSALEKVTLPEGITDIGDFAFDMTLDKNGGNYVLKSITFPASLRTIGVNAFIRNHALESVVIPSGVTSIGNRAFTQCSSLSSIVIPPSVTSLGILVVTGLDRQVTVYGEPGSAADKMVKDINRTYEGAITWHGVVFKPLSAAPITPPTPTLTATPTASIVLVNGESVAFDAYNINNNNYFKLRDLAYILSGTETQFEVSWDGANNAIALTSGKSYTAVGGEMTGKGAGNKTPSPTSSKIYLDGKEIQFTAYTIEGNNYFKLRDIGETFDFEVDWDGSRNTIVIDTSKSYTPD